MPQATNALPAPIAPLKGAEARRRDLGHPDPLRSHPFGGPTPDFTLAHDNTTDAPALELRGMTFDRAFSVPNNLAAPASAGSMASSAVTAIASEVGGSVSGDLNGIYVQSGVQAITNTFEVQDEVENGVGNVQGDTAPVAIITLTPPTPIQHANAGIYPTTIEEASEEFEILVRRNDELVDGIFDRQEELDVLIDDLAVKNTEFIDACVKVMAKKQECEELNVKIDLKTKEHAELRAKVETYKDELKGTIGIMTKEHAELCGKIKGSTKELEELCAKVKDREKRLAELTTKKKEAETKAENPSIIENIDTYHKLVDGTGTGEGSTAHGTGTSFDTVAGDAASTSEDTKGKGKAVDGGSH